MIIDRPADTAFLLAVASAADEAMAKAPRGGYIATWGKVRDEFRAKAEALAAGGDHQAAAFAAGAWAYMQPLSAGGAENVLSVRDRVAAGGPI